MQKDKSSDEEFDELVRAVADELDADIIGYSGEIRSPHDFQFRRIVRANKRRTNVLLMLATTGGSADAAYRMGRCLQRHYPDGKIVVHIDWICKSAGTLLAMAGTELILADRAELGPLDVQLSKTDELGELSSGLTPIQALQTLQEQSFALFEDHFLKLRVRSGLQISTKSAAHIATNLAVGLFRPIYEQLDPLRVAEEQRAMMIAYEYGVRLGSKNLHHESLDILLTDYPSHGFVIDRREAEQLFKNVREPTEAENILANALFEIVKNSYHGQGHSPINQSLTGRLSSTDGVDSNTDDSQPKSVTHGVHDEVRSDHTRTANSKTQRKGENRVPASRPTSAS